MNFRNIENIKNEQQLLSEIKKQNDNFDIFDFYLKNENDNNGAVQIIMPNHTLSCNVALSHKLVTQNIYKLIYKDFKEFTTDVWQEESCERSNVLFQLCPGSFSLGWFPENITEYQLRRIVLMKAMIDEVNFEIKNSKKLSRKFLDRIRKGEKPVTVETNVKSNGKILTLDKVIPKIIKRVKK